MLQTIFEIALLVMATSMMDARIKKEVKEELQTKRKEKRQRLNFK